MNKKFPLADLLRQSVYSRLAGYEDLNDAARVSADPTFRLIGSEKNWHRGAALTSTLHGFETGTLTSKDNLLGLMALNRELVGRAEAGDESERVVLDMDSTGKPRPWATGRERLQRPFRVGLLPPAVVVQPARRLSGGEAALRECPQRRGLG